MDNGFLAKKDWSVKKLINPFSYKQKRKCQTALLI